MQRPKALLLSTIYLGLQALVSTANAQVVSHLVVAPIQLAQDGHANERNNEHRVTLQLRTTDNASLLWPADRVDWLYIRGAGQQANHHTLASTVDDVTRAHVSLPSRMLPGTLAKIGLDLEPRLVTHSRDSLRAFVLTRAMGIDLGAIDALPEQVRVLHIESCTALVRTQRADVSQEVLDISHRPSPVAMQKAGQQLELRPLYDPTVFDGVSDLSVRAYVAGVALKDEPVSVVPPTAQDVVASSCTLPTDDKGIATLPINRPGEWTLELAHLTVTPNAQSHDAVLYTASLTFLVPTPTGHAPFGNAALPRTPARHAPRTPTSGRDTTGGRP